MCVLSVEYRWSGAALGRSAAVCQCALRGRVRLCWVAAAAAERAAAGAAAHLKMADADAAVGGGGGGIVCEKLCGSGVEARSDIVVGGGLSAASGGAPTVGHDVDITLDINMPASPHGDDCRKKRCVDRYDSSESSDSGVAILSCTDCSGSSTASSDITDPGSPFSTASTHSEDSGNSNQPTKMPPTQNVHHPPWPWTAEELSAKDTPAMVVKQVAALKDTPSKQRQAIKRKETSSSNSTQKCLNNNLTTSNRNAQTTTAAHAAHEPSPNKKPAIMNNVKLSNTSNNQQQATLNGVANVTILPPSAAELLVGMDPKAVFPRLQQGKITEYFKSQYKSSTILKKELSNIMIKTIANPNSKFAASKKLDVIPKKAIPRLHRQASMEKPIVKSPRTIPRKILPAPSKAESNNGIISMGHQITANNYHPPIITTLIPNVYAIQAPQAKTPSKPTDSSGIYVPQFALNDKLNAIPIMTTRGTPPLGIIQPLQKVTTINSLNNINNFVKLNTSASMMPTILKLNANFHHQQTNVINTVAVPSVGCKPVEGSVNSVTAVTTSHHQVISNVMETETHSTCEERLVGEDGNKAEAVVAAKVETRTQLPEELSPADSGVSSNLEVLINDDELLKADAAQKSPILSQPKTIRFPAKERLPVPKKIAVRADRAACQWDQCAAQFDTNGALLEHLQVKHVISQEKQEQYVCLWQGCKVHGRKSCSRSWLERHVLAHAGSKPFRCIVDGCGQRFNSQLALERHVNGHFSTDGTQNGNAKKSLENTSVKLFKRNGKKIRFRRQPWSARMFDFIDSGMMEGLQYRLLTMTEKRTNGKFDSTDGQTVTLSSQILAKRVELDGTRKLLLRWHPSDILEDEWVVEKEYTKTKDVQIPNLHATAKDNLRPILFPHCSSTSDDSSSSSSCSSPAGRQKHRRKPLHLHT